MKTITLERTRIEVGGMTRGRPSYRWTTGYYVITPEGRRQYPPARRAEAYAMARKQWPGCKIVVKDET